MVLLEIPCRNASLNTISILSPADELNRPHYATRCECPVLARCRGAASDRFAARYCQFGKRLTNPGNLKDDPLCSGQAAVP
jgi:hypothetical protein